jgi:hypothetical protein
MTLDTQTHLRPRRHGVVFTALGQVTIHDGMQDFLKVSRLIDLF